MYYAIVYASRIPPRPLETWRLGGLEDSIACGLDARVCGLGRPAIFRKKNGEENDAEEN